MNQRESRDIRISPDALIALVVTEAEERELSSLPSLDEMNASFHPSENFQKRIKKLIKLSKKSRLKKKSGVLRSTYF